MVRISKEPIHHTGGGRDGILFSFSQLSETYDPRESRDDS